MSIINDLTGIISILSGVRNNRVANFAYKDAAYNNDQADGVSTYNPANNNNIPSASADTLDTNPTVLSEGFRSQASVLTRMLVNHFFGRVSYNLNKTVDKLTEALTDIKNALGVADGIAQLDANGKIPDLNLSDTVKTAFNGISQGNDSVTVSRLSGQNAATFPTMSGASEGSAGKPGLVPKPASGDNTKFLRGDGAWEATPYPGSVSTASEGLMPRLDGSTEKFMRGDGTWATPEQSVYTLPIASASTLGGVKVGTNLSIDPVSGVLAAQDTTYSNASDISAGLLAQLPASGQDGYYLRGDNTWQETGSIEAVGSAKALTSQGAYPDTDSADMAFYGSDTHVMDQAQTGVALTQWRMLSFGGVEMLCMSFVNQNIEAHTGSWTLTYHSNESELRHACYSLGAPVVRGAPSGFLPASASWVGANLVVTMSANGSTIPTSMQPCTVMFMMTHDAHAITSAGYL